MSINDFDKLFKEKFEEHEFAYNPMNWEKITHALPQEKHKRRVIPWLTGIAASVALVVGASWWMHHKTDGNDDVNITKTESPENTLPQNVVPAIPEPDIKTTDVQDPLKQITPVSNNILANTKNIHTALPDESVNTIEEKKIPNSPITQPYEKNLLSFTPNPVISKSHEEIVTKSDPQKNLIKPITHENIEGPVFSPDESEKPQGRKTSISLAGGFNYGTFNTGYGASVNARQKISNKLFIEGDLGFMQNQEVIASAMSTSHYNMMRSGQFRGRPARLEEKPYNIYYLQMSPSIGYQLHKNISVGVGADVQKLLDGNVNDRPVVATEEGFKLIPLWDAGITGKTEYSISRRLKAGILYREGVNNLLQGNSNYYERRYLQVQMKLRLFGK